MLTHISTVRLFSKPSRALTIRSFSCLSVASRRKGNIPTSSQQGILEGHDSSRTTCNVLTGRRYISKETFVNWLSPENPAIGLAVKLLENVHDTTGLPWWGTIVVTTITLRFVVTTPLTIHSMKNAAKLQNLRPEMDKMAKDLNVEVSHAANDLEWDKNVARRVYHANMKRLVSEQYVKHNCHPYKNFIALLGQIPLWISMSLALRNLSGSLAVSGLRAPVLAPDLAQEGTLWFSNLLLPDTTLILPVTMGLFLLAITEMRVLQVPKGKHTRGQMIMTYVMRGMAVVMVPIGAVVPSCMCLYWACSTGYGLMQNIAMEFPEVKRRLHIPSPPAQSQTPFQDIWTNAKVKYSRKSIEDSDK